jgi:hypothetical protein
MSEARIYRPTKTAMQSGKKNTQKWVLEFLPEDERFVEPIMGWTGSADTTQQLRIKFADKEAAIEYAKRKGIIYRVIEPNTAKMSIRAYSDNFM